MATISTTSQQSHLLSVIVPTRNEAQTIVETLRRLRICLPEAEVWVVDGGSDDTPTQLAHLLREWPHLHYVKNSNDRGKGHAIREGIRLCTRPFLAQLDSDLQFWPEDLPLLLDELLEKEADFVCGSRFRSGSKRSAKSVPGLRSLGNRTISLYASALSGTYFTDVLAGIKVWRREVTEAFRLQSDDYCYEVELPMKALRCGFRVIEAPVRTEPRLHGSSSVNVVRTGLALLQQIPRFRWQAEL